MTPFEHAMVGINLTLVCVAQKRHGWGLAIATGAAAALPDWDGLSILFGARAYSTVHRVWGHNLLVAGLVGAATGAVGYLCQRSLPIRRALKVESTPGPYSSEAILTWVLLGTVAGVSHVPLDVIFSGPAGAAWPVVVFWPFSDSGWAKPLVPWGDLGGTIIFIAEMFALYRYPQWSRALAFLASLLLLAYIAVRAWL